MAQISNKTAVFATLAALALVIVGYCPRVNAQPTPAPEREQLLNGLTILYGNRAGDPNLLLKLRIKSGAAFDLAGKAGSMALLADAMFPESTAQEYVAEQLGGRLEVSTTYDSIDVTISGKSSDLERMVELLRSAILNVNLSAESVATLREARIKQLAEKSSNAETADRAVAARLFGSYPYGTPAQGTPETVAKIDRADLMLARERFLNAENATLAVVGGVEKPRLMRALRQLLGPWQKGDRIVPATFRQPGGVDDRVLLIDQPATNVEVRLAVRGLSRSDPDLMAASFLAHIANTRWQAAVPELATTSYVRVDSHALSGLIVFAAKVPPASAAKAIAAAKKVMTTLTESAPPESEIPGIVMSSQMPPPEMLLASAWLDAETYKLPAATSSGPGRVRPDDIRRVAGRLFGNSAPLAIVVLGSASELQTQLGYKIELRSVGTEPKPPITPAFPLKKP
jgi:predicted Zn-dependent peptidase